MRNSAFEFIGFYTYSRLFSFFVPTPFFILPNTMESKISPPTASLFLRDNASIWMGHALQVVPLIAVFFSEPRHCLLTLNNANIFADNLASDRDFVNFIAVVQERGLGFWHHLAKP